AGGRTGASGGLQAQGATERPGATDSAAPCGELPASIRDLRPMTAGIAPISDDERHTRLEKARRLMADNRTAAICLEGGSSLFYFTRVRWGLSERPFVAGVSPQRGNPRGWPALLQAR